MVLNQVCVCIRTNIGYCPFKKKLQNYSKPNIDNYGFNEYTIINIDNVNNVVFKSYSSKSNYGFIMKINKIKNNDYYSHNQKCSSWYSFVFYLFSLFFIYLND